MILKNILGKFKRQNSHHLALFSTLCFILNSWNSLATYHKLELEETPADFYTSGKCPCATGTIDYPYQLPNSRYLQMTSVKDQGPLGTCVSFATSATAEYHYKHRFSEAEFTVLAQTHKLGNHCEGGLFLGNALRVARQYGFVPEDKFPYARYLTKVAFKNGIDISYEGWEGELRLQEDAKICTMSDYNGSMKEFGVDLALTGNPRVDYTNYRLSNLQVIHHVSKASQALALHRPSAISLSELGSYLGDLRISSSILSQQASVAVGTPLQADIESVEKALCCGAPVVVALDIYQNCWNNPSSKSNYQIKMPQMKDSVEGSHAIVVTGFNYQRKLFEIKNSWGSSWGNNGYAELPYDYLKRYATEIVAIGAPSQIN